MIKTKTILGVAAAIATILIASPMMAEAITDLTSTVVTTTPNVDHDIKFNLAGIVPTDAFGGFAIFTTEGDVIAVTSHKKAYDSEAQAYPNKNKTFDICNNGLVNAGFCDGVWHTHLVKPVGHPACQIAAIGALTFEQPSQSVSIAGNMIIVEGVPIGLIPSTNSVTGQSMGFTVGESAVSPNPVTNLADPGVAFDLNAVFDGKTKDKNLVAICIGPTV